MPDNPFAKYRTSPQTDRNPFAKYRPVVEPIVEPESDRGDFGRGIGTAFKQVPQLGYGLVAGAGAVAEKAFGEGGISTGIKESGVEGFERWGAKVAETAKESDSLSYSWNQAKEGNYGALVDWLQYGLGYAGGQAIQIIATAGVGGVAAKTASVGAVSMAKGMVAKESARLLATKEGVGYTAEQLAKTAVANVSAKIGQTTALAGTAFGMEGGEIYGDLVSTATNEGRELSGAELAKAFGSTVAAGSLEFVGDKIGLNLMLGKGLGGIGGRTVRGAAGAGIGLGVEAGTEYLQTGTEEYGKGTETAVFPWMQSEEAQKQAFDAAGLGALGGANIGGVGGALSSPAPEGLINNNTLADVAASVTDPNKSLDESISEAGDIVNTDFTASEFGTEPVSQLGTFTQDGVEFETVSPVVATQPFQEAAETAIPTTPDQVIPQVTVEQEAAQEAESEVTLGSGNNQYNISAKDNGDGTYTVTAQAKASADGQVRDTTYGSNAMKAGSAQEAIEQARETIRKEVQSGLNRNQERREAVASERPEMLDDLDGEMAVQEDLLGALLEEYDLAGQSEATPPTPDVTTQAPLEKIDPVRRNEVVLQNRDRSSPESIAQMKGIANNPDPSRLSFSRDAANGAPVVFDTPPDNIAYGKTDRAVTASGRKLDMQYAVVEAEDVIASNTMNGSANPDYINDTPALRVIGGNGRIAGLQEAVRLGTASDYVAGIVEDSGLHGVTPEQIATFNNPVLVRVMRNEDVTPNIGDEFNGRQNMELSSVEQAKTDVRRLVMESLEFDENGKLTTAAVKSFVLAMPENERSGLMDKGQPGQKATDRVMAALFYQAYGDEELVRIYAQATEAESKAVITASAAAAPAMARLQNTDIDIRSVVVDAIKVVVSARRNGISLESASKQADIDLGPLSQWLVGYFAKNIRSPKRIAEMLNTIAKRAYDESNKPSVDMFGETPKSTADDIFKEQGYESETAQVNGNQGGAESVPVLSGIEADVESRQGKARTSEEPAFDLAGQSEAEIAADADAITTETKAKTDREAAEDKVKSDAEQAERVKSNVDSMPFVMGQDSAEVTRSAETGVDDLFGQPESEVATEGLTEPTKDSTELPSNSLNNFIHHLIAISQKQHPAFDRQSDSKLNREVGIERFVESSPDAADQFAKEIDGLSDEELKNIAPNFLPIVTRSFANKLRKPVADSQALEPAQEVAGRETITPANDTNIGVNYDGQQLYERKDGSVYRLDTRNKGKPTFGGDLVLVEQAQESEVGGEPVSRSKSKNIQVAPQLISENRFNSLITMAADSVRQLRKSDVYRVLDFAEDAFKLDVAGKIKKARPDLVTEVDEVMDELTNPETTSEQSDVTLVEILPSMLVAGDSVRVGNDLGVVLAVDGSYIKFRSNTATNDKAFHRVLSKSATFISRPDTTSTSSASKSQDEEFGTEEGKLEADMGGLIAVLGAGMYAANVADVTVKELLQNSFDATKGAIKIGLIKSGEITITLDEQARTLSVSDNARGMTPSIVREAFFTVAGSDKSDLDPSERSGGLGLAKMGFMLGSERLRLETTRDGMKVVVDATAKEIAGSKFKVEKLPAKKSEHGTVVTVTVPKTYADPKTGVEKTIWMPLNQNSIDALNQPLIGNVVVKFVRKGYGDDQVAVLPIGNNFDEKLTPKLTSATFSWGTADIYFGVERKDRPKHKILSSGVYQFDTTFKMGQSEMLPFDVIVNVKPNIVAQHPDYPFENSRERFKGRIDDDIKALHAYLAKIARGNEAAGLQESFKGIVSMPRLEAGTELADASKKLSKAFDTRSKEDKPYVLPEMPKEVFIGEGFVRDSSGVELAASKPTDNKKGSTFVADKEAPTSADFMLEMANDPKLPIYHNNTNADFLDIGREYGEPEQFFSELGTLIVEMKEAMSTSGRYSYDQLAPENLFFAGISVDKQYAGIHIKVPYKAILINPFYDWGAKTLFGVRGNLMLTIVHEIAHQGDMDHGVGHNGEMLGVEQYLNDTGMRDYFWDALIDILTRHESTFTEMRNAYGRSTTQNIAKSLEDYDKSSPSRSLGGTEGRGDSEPRPVPARGQQGGGGTNEADSGLGDEGIQREGARADQQPKSELAQNTEAMREVVAALKAQTGAVKPAAEEASATADQEIVIGKFETGKPVTFNYAHNTESATALFGIPDENAEYGRQFEPSGKFMTESNQTTESPNIERGSVTFNNPLVIRNDGLEWKKSLSQNYNDLTGKELSKAIIADGHDGIVTVEADSDGNPRYVSEIVDLTTFDESKALYSKEADDKSLYVAHNLSAENLLHAKELGGLASPSLAVADIEKGSFDGFGEITLLADPSITNSPKARTFDADVYSPRQPRAKYTISREGFAEYEARIKADIAEFPFLRMPSLEEMSDRGAEEMLRSDAVRYQYLKERGVNIPAYKTSGISRSVRAAANSTDLTKTYQLKDDKNFVKRAEAHYRKEEESLPEGMKGFLEFFDDSGQLNNQYLDSFAQEVVSLKESGGIDTYKVSSAINKKFRSKKTSNDFEKYVTDKFNDMVDGKKLFKGYSYSGNRKYAPYNMETVLKEMTKSLQGGEGFNYGAGSLRSVYAEEIKSIKEIKNRKWQLVSNEEMQKTKDESQDKLLESLDELKPYYKYQSDSFGYYDDASSAIAEGSRGLKEAFDLDSNGEKIVSDLISYLRSLPTEYFETKIQRAVGIEEFSAAVVPRGTRKDAVDFLRSQGLTIRFYKKGDQADRMSAVKSFKKLLFSQGRESPTTHTVGSATQRVTDVLESQQKGLGELVEGGAVVIHNAAQIPESVLGSVDSGKIRAYVDPSDNTVHIIADNIPLDFTDAQILGLIKHEVSVHAMKLGKSDKEFQSILKQADAMRKNGSAKMREAFARVPEDTAAENVSEEALAYFIETNPTHSLAQRLMAWFRKTLKAIGFNNKWLNTLTEGDLIQMATDALISARSELLAREAVGDVAMASQEQEQSEYDQAVAKGLDMSKEARLRRARDMGFDTTKTYYHGTIVSDQLGDIDAFDITRSMKVFGRKESYDHLGVWLSDNPTDSGAGMYAPDREGAIYPIFHSAKNLKKTSFLHIPKRIEQYGGVSGYRDHLISQGYDGISIESIPEIDGGEFSGQNAIVIFDPKNIRSVNAAFDPDYSDSSNILFSQAPAETDNSEVNFAAPEENLATAAIRKIQDKFKVLKDLQANIKKAGGTISETGNPYRAEEAFHGKAEDDIRLMRENHVEPLANKMAEYGIEMDALDKFITAKHAPERNAHIADINPDMPDGGSGMTNAEAAIVIAKVEAEGNTKQYEDLASRVYAILQEQRDLIRNGNLEDKEGLIDTWEAQYEFYVPLKGFAADTESEGIGGTGKGFNIGGKESKLALGRSSESASPTAFAITDLTRVIIRKRKNEVGNALLEMIENNPNKAYWEVFTDENPDTQRRLVNGVVKNVSVPMAMMQDNYFTTKRGGKTYYMALHDPRMMKAMKNLGPETNGALIRTLANINRILSALNTSYSPEFIISNFSKDIQTAILNLSAEQSLDEGKAAGKKIIAQTVKDVPAAMKAIYASLRGKKLTGDAAKWQADFDRFRADGAKTGYFDMKDLDGQVREMNNLVEMAKGGIKGKATGFMKSAAQVVENINSSVENAVRLSAYVNAIRAGVSRAEAASLAKNMTVNFNRRGEMGTTLNALYMFANASIQGVANFTRTMGTLKGDKKLNWENLNNAQRLAVGIVAGTYFLALANRESAGDDDDDVSWYDKVPDYVKERNLVFMKSLFGGPQDGTYWKIPMPYGYNVFGVMGVGLESVFNGGNSPIDESGNIILATLGSFSPVGFQDSQSVTGLLLKNAAPTVVKPVVEIALNENFFGSSIYSENFPFGDQKPESALGRRSTPAAYQAVATWMNKVTGGSQQRSGAVDVNPDIMNYVMDYFGGASYGFFGTKLPDYATRKLTGVETEDYKTPFLSRLAGRVMPYEDMTLFYDRRDEIGQIKAEMRAPGASRSEFRRENRGMIRLIPQVRRTERRLSALRKRRDFIYAKDITEAARDSQLKLIEQQMKSSVDKFNKAYNEARQ